MLSLLFHLVSSYVYFMGFLAIWIFLIDKYKSEMLSNFYLILSKISLTTLLGERRFQVF